MWTLWKSRIQHREQLQGGKKNVLERRRFNRAAAIAVKNNPALWDKAKRAACSQGGLCPHSARKMQWATKYYKQHGGTYAGRRSSRNSMDKWTKEAWGTSSGKPSDGKRRYLPKEKWHRLSPKDKRRTNAAKARGTKQGKQYVPQPPDIVDKLKGGCQYRISTYTRKQAARLGVTVRLASNPAKKIDVFKDGHKVATVGACGYKDYPTFLREDGKEVANRKRNAFKSRFERYRHRRGSKAWYADQLLW